MGCLNSTGTFAHWFGNIHLSGPCNRRCYFCIGQHMMALDGLDTTGAWPLPGFADFVEKCRARDVREVYVTGTNTDPLLYKHTPELVDALRRELPGCSVGVRTNAVAHLNRLSFYDKGSVTICSTNPVTYRGMMGVGSPPDLKKILAVTYGWSSLKVNVVLGPENFAEIPRLLDQLAAAGIRRVNLREPYGQPRVGNPLFGKKVSEIRLGMPVYQVGALEATYWDVHYVEVESVNLYANGRVSEDYPITRGHDPAGAVSDQSAFPGGRVREQWVSVERLRVAT